MNGVNSDACHASQIDKFWLCRALPPNLARKPFDIISKAERSCTSEWVRWQDLLGKNKFLIICLPSLP